MNIQKQIEQLEQTINKAQSELEGLKQEASKPKPMFDRVEDGEKYFYINDTFSVSHTNEDNYNIDNKLYDLANYYVEKDKHIAERVGEYYKNNNWFIRKAIEFADGYEWELGGDNWCVYIDAKGKNEVTKHASFNYNGTIYMTKENALKFKAWLEECKPLK